MPVYYLSMTLDLTFLRAVTLLSIFVASVPATVYGLKEVLNERRINECMKDSVWYIAGSMINV